MRTTFTTVLGAKGRTETRRRYIVVDAKSGAVLYRTDDPDRAGAYARRARHHQVIDTVALVGRRAARKLEAELRAKADAIGGVLARCYCPCDCLCRQGPNPPCGCREHA